MLPDTVTSDREADEYELRLHRKSATSGFRLGALLTGLASLLFLLTGYVYIGMLLVPGIVLLVNAWTHRDKGNALESRLRSDRSGSGAAGRASPPSTLGRGSHVLVTWTDGARYPGFILQLRGQHYFVRLDAGEIRLQHE